MRIWALAGFFPNPTAGTRPAVLCINTRGYDPEPTTIPIQWQLGKLPRKDIVMYLKTKNGLKTARLCWSPIWLVQKPLAARMGEERNMLLPPSEKLTSYYGFP